jgi:uncharacterized protein YuzE
MPSGKSPLRVGAVLIPASRAAGTAVAGRVMQRAKSWCRSVAVVQPRDERDQADPNRNAAADKHSRRCPGVRHQSSDLRRIAEVHQLQNERKQRHNGDGTPDAGGRFHAARLQLTAGIEPPLAARYDPAVRVSYDAEADAAYIYLREIGPGEAAYTYPAEAEIAVDMINLDFDGDGRLIGIEVLSAKAHLPVELLATAARR